MIRTILAAALFAATVSAQSAPLPKLKVSDNRRFLVTASGKPFFYLADTGWHLFHRLDREQATLYLEDRARKGFNVIQAVALAELHGLSDANPYGHTPLVNLDPTRPDTRPGPGNDYWDHVDFIVQKANSLGIYIGLLPTWGDKWNKKWGTGPEIFTPANAEIYGRWLGERYRSAGIIWILGGDRPVESARHVDIIRAFARGIRAGDQGAHLITFHPRGGQGSAQFFHDEAWLDFNMRQNGHGLEFTNQYARTAADYALSPVKPVLDAEPVYEDHPISFKAPELGHSTAADVRRPLYWNLFSGACGHTYGHHAVWQMWTPARKPVNNPLMAWQEAIAQPGAAQMVHGRRLIESRPYLTRIPDDSIIVTSAVPTAVPGTGRYRFTATRDSSGSYAMIYAPIGRPFSVQMDKITGPIVAAWWYSPRDGKATRIGTFPNSGVRQFTPPDPGELLDWILVLDDASKNFAPPGTPQQP